MRAIDGDELLEHVWRERLDSRERIAELVERMPTLNTKNLVINEMNKIVSDYYKYHKNEQIKVGEYEFDKQTN